MVLFFYFLSRYLFSRFSAAKRLHCFFKFYIMNYTTKKKSDSRFTAFPLLKSCQPTLVDDTNGAFPFMKQELTKPSSLRAISMLAVFTFLFLSTEYFYVNQIAQNASSARTVNVQNYALGISAVGFCLYPLLFRFFRHRLRSAVFFALATLAIVCFVILGSPVAPGLLPPECFCFWFSASSAARCITIFFVKFLTKNISHAWSAFPMGLLSCCSF